MAPIIKTRRRAEAEIEEMKQWFSTILDDQSHFMRYENITYPEVEYEDHSNLFEDEMIDDEFRTGHKIWNWGRLTNLLSQSNTGGASDANTVQDLIDMGYRFGPDDDGTWFQNRFAKSPKDETLGGQNKENDGKSEESLLSPFAELFSSRTKEDAKSSAQRNRSRRGHPVSNRWYQYKVSLPVFVLVTTGLMFVPIVWSLIKMVFFNLSSWFFDAEEAYINPDAKHEEDDEGEGQEKDGVPNSSSDNGDNGDNNSNIINDNVNNNNGSGNNNDYDQNVNDNNHNSNNTTHNSDQNDKNPTPSVPDLPITFSQPTHFIQQQQQQLLEQQRYITKAIVNPQDVGMVGNHDDLVQQVAVHQFSAKGD